ncbi:MAG: hypothetical protein JNM99_09430 [Verrucomicrobiaceae bacterium]|nr:hypothetical protein [Verrucomicrobiaceae bacterium]
MREGPLNDGEGQPEAKVRYRFYTDAHRNVASPVINARVDKAWIEWCRCDAMGLRDAPLAIMIRVAQQGSPSLPQRLLEKLESYQRESLTPEGQEWVRMDAIRAISSSKQVFEATKALEQIVGAEKPKSRLWSAAVEGLCDLQKESLDGWAAWLLKPEQQKRTELVEAHLFRIGFAAVRWAPWHFAEDFDQWLEDLVSKPSHPLSQSAGSVYACGFPQEKHHSKLTALWKAAEPGLYKEKLVEFVRRVSPHKVLGITQTCPDHRTARITLTNISGLPIEFDVPSPRSVVRFSLIEESTNRSFAEKPIHPGQSKRVRLAVGEHLTLPDFILDDLFELPSEGDISVSLRSQTNLPEFGELPALPNGYSGLRVSNGMFRILN